MARIWIHKSKSPEETAAFELSYYLKMSPTQRLETVQYIREGLFQRMKKIKGKNGKRLRRVLKIIKQA